MEPMAAASGALLRNGAPIQQVEENWHNVGAVIGLDLVVTLKEDSEFILEPSLVK